MKYQIGDSLPHGSEKIILNYDGALAINSGLMDADVGIFFQRQLEKIKAKTYDVRHQDLKARTLFPVSNEGGPGITTITYRSYDMVGQAKIITAYAKDLPRADVFGKEVSIPVRSVGIAYGYNVDEINSAQLSGFPLDQRRANAGERGIEEKIDDVAWNGDADSGMPGLLTNADIPVGNVPNGVGGNPEFSTKTPDEVLLDLNNLLTDIFSLTKMKETGNTVLMPPDQWSLIMTTPRSTQSDTTIAEFFVKSSPWINSLDDLVPINELSGAGTGGVDIMIAYDKSPDKVELEIPVELEWFPAQQKGLEFEIPGRARIAGLNIYYPLAFNIKEDI